MDFKQETDFREADRRYADLARQRDAGGISEEEFEAQRQRLMVLDEEGRWWSKSPEGGEWHYHDGSAWVRGTPPAYREAAPEAAPQPMGGRTQAAATPAARRKRSVWPWLLGIVIVLVGLAGIGLIVWSFVPAGSLPSFLTGGSQGESAPEEGGSGGGGAGVDATFVHRATADNVSANSTFLDNDLLNDNPAAIVYVTQSWNPDGGDGVYNDHPVGVWYDEGQGRWAIFNQDREAMPEGAAFNVAVVESPPE